MRDVAVRRCYDPDGPLRAAGAPPPPFRIDFVAGGDAAAGCVFGAEAMPLALLYFCDGCSRIVSRRDLAEDIDSYYCSHCLENMPSSEAMAYGMRCSKCWECPVCSTTAAMCVASRAASEQCYHFACNYCRWTSRGLLEAAQPEQLVAKVNALEREAEPRQRMAALVDAFRTRAQEQQREQELAHRLKRRSSLARGSFAAGALSSFAARRFSSALLLRNTRAGLLDGLEQAGTSGPWRIDDLEVKLRDQAGRSADLRAEARASAAAASSAAAAAGTRGMGGVASSAEPLVVKVPDLPVVEGLTVQQLLRAHAEGTGAAALMEQMTKTLDDGAEEVSSLAQRLQQVAYGHHGIPAKVVQGKVIEAAVEQHTGLRSGRVQLESPLQHLDTWALLPLRKPLLTKRSRRCRLLVKGSEKDEKVMAQPATMKACKGIVVKPQINPCSNPAFQKNNVAVAFIPRCTPWAWSGDSGVGEGGVAQMAASTSSTAVAKSTPRPHLKKGEVAELVFTMSNPLDAEVEVSIDPTVGNVKGEGQSDFTEGIIGLDALVAEQNMDVVTQAFKTTIARYDDLADVHDAFSGEDAARWMALKAEDDSDVIPDRKMHKILVRLRFKARAAVLHDLADPGPWVFYARMGLAFMDASSNQHEVTTILRFGMDASRTAAPPLVDLPLEAQASRTTSC